MHTLLTGTRRVVDAPPGSHSGRELLTETIPELKTGAWRLRSSRIVRVVARPPIRIIFYQVAHEPSGGGRVRTEQLVGKVYGAGDGADALAALQRLREDGFRPPAPYRVPRPYGYSRVRRVLLQARAPGVVWAELLRQEDPSLLDASARAASWLIALQRSAVTDGRETWRDDRLLAEQRARALVSAFPGHGPRLSQLAECLDARLRLHTTAAVRSHGDYHPENVFLAPGKVTVIDFDTFGLRERAFDVGDAMGQLLFMSRIWLGDVAPGARAALAFWRRYEVKGRAPWSRVAVHVARSFLYGLYYELCAVRNDRADLLEPWTAHMDAWLKSEDPGTLMGLIGRSPRRGPLRRRARLASRAAAAATGTTASRHADLCRE